MTGRVTDPSGPAHYEIRVGGVLDGRWTAWFNGLQISGQGEETVISGLVPDQSALHGLLTKVRDLGLCLISVRRVDPVEAGNEAPLSRRGAGPRAASLPGELLHHWRQRVQVVDKE